MPPESRHGWLLAAAVELLFYCLAAGSFLWVYITRFQAPLSVIPAHLVGTLSVLVIPAGFRLIVWGLLPVGAARAVATVVCVGTLVLLLGWYAMVLVGLDSWGRVTTWALLRTYAGQAPHLLTALGFSPWQPIVLAVGVMLMLAAVAWRYFILGDWTRVVAGKGGKPWVVMVSAGLIISALLHLYVSTQTGSGHPADPLVIGFGKQARAGLQSHVVSGAAVLDAREEAVRRRYVPEVRTHRRNLIIIVGDALRADHMSVYGYGRNTTPALAAILRERGGVVVPAVRAACAESTCGLMALAASRPVSELGSSPLTLQESLRRNGYKAHFILGGDHTNFYGLDRMYGELDSYFDGSRQSRRYMNDDQLVLDNVEQLPRWDGHPVAFQFHFMSTHGLGKRDPSLSPFAPSSNYYAWPGSSPKRPPSPLEAEYAVNHYDNGVLRFDRMATEVLASLEAKGYLEDALVVVTGDHGEMLGELGYFSHQFGLSEAVLDIPLILLRYGYSGKQFPASPWNSQIDIAPTIARELDIPVPASWKGRALQSEWIPRDIEIQQARHFGLYHVDENGQVRKYVHDLDSGREIVTDPIGDPLGKADLKGEVPDSLLNRWRLASAAGMLNSIQGR